MITSERIAFKDFNNIAEELSKVVQDLLSTSFGSMQIFINTLPSLDQALLCPILNKHSDCISIREFLDLCAQKWEREINYQEEILQLKDGIFAEMDKILLKVLSKELNAAIKKGMQETIENIFNLTLFDEKQLAGEFCKCFMNGFEYQVIDKFHKFAFYVLWMPFSIPLPLEVINFIHAIFENELSELNELNLKNSFFTINQFVENHFKNSVVIVDESTEASELITIIRKILAQRKKVSLTVKRLDDFQLVIKELRTEIDFVGVVVNAEKFIENDIVFPYESLEVEELNKNISVEEIFKKIPKHLRELKLHLKGYQNKDLAALAKLFPKLVNLSDLQINFRYILVFQQFQQPKQLFSK